MLSGKQEKKMDVMKVQEQMMKDVES